MDDIPQSVQEEIELVFELFDQKKAGTSTSVVFPSAD